ncbi:MAG: NupC/NupG family nucleoside CNT transporter [Brevinema sp.]
MRFMGIVGILVFLGIAFLFSKNKKAINWQTVFWGLGLQVLFALAILGNNTVSFSATVLFLLLIIIYLAKVRFIPFLRSEYYPIKIFHQIPEPIAIVISIIKFGVFGLLIGYFFGKTHETLITHIINGLWILITLIWLSRKFIHHKYLHNIPLNSALIVATISINLGLCIAIAELTGGERGTMAYNMQQLSIAVGNFLTIPTNAGASMIFGSLTEIKEPWYFLFFVQVLPTIVFFSAFISVLYYLGIVQILIQELALFMQWTMKTSGAETLSCSGNIFVGQTEAPILIKPYLKDMTNSEIHAIMTGGFATIAGGVFAGFVAMGIDAGHLISASLMSAPAALTLSKIFYPETEHSQTEGNSSLPEVKISDNVIGAAAQGTMDGLQLSLTVGAMLLSFIALIKVINMGLGMISDTLSLNMIFGSLFQYVALILGVPANDMQAVGSLLGNKITINEFVAYGNLVDFINNNMLSERSQVIATYALCGFANFGSIGIQIGGITPMAPERKKDIASLGFSAMWAGAFASWMTAAIAGMFIA